MKYLRSIVLILAAIIATKVAVTLVGVLVSVSQLVAELSPVELERRTAYIVIIVYCAIGLLLTLANGMMIYLEAKRRNTLKALYLLAPISALLFGAHLTCAYVIGISNDILNEFVKDFAWLPMLAILVTAILLVIRKL